MEVTINNPAEIAKDPLFDSQLVAIIEEVKEQNRKTQAEAKTDLKANPFIRLQEDGKLTLEFIKAEFPKITNKQSDLSAGKRDTISRLVFNAAQRTVLLKRAERAQRIAEKANARVAAEEVGQAPEPSKPAKPKGSIRKAKKLAKKGKK